MPHTLTPVLPSECPCGGYRQLTHYQACCQPYHLGQLATNPEVLMRARYSAFALQRTDFIQRTWAAETCPGDLTDDSDTQWVALKVISSKVNPPPRQHTGSVHFKATCQDTDGRQHCLEERSRFIKRQGEWFYLDGKTKFTEVAASL